MSTGSIDRMIKTLSTGLSRTEAQKLQNSLKIKGVREKFEDPLTARKIMEKFQLPVFRRDYFEDPLTAINKIDRYSTDPQPDIPRRK
jgi:hypothetical protein